MREIAFDSHLPHPVAIDVRNMDLVDVIRVACRRTLYGGMREAGVPSEGAASVVFEHVEACDFRRRSQDSRFASEEEVEIPVLISC